MVNKMSDTERRFNINKNCWFEVQDWGGSKDVYLTYIEHSPDHWYSDYETDVIIERDDAINIIEFLRKEFDID